MYDSFNVVSSTGSYPVAIEAGGFPGFISRCDRTIVIADSFLRDAPALSVVNAETVLFFEASEAIKSLEALPRLIEAMRGCGANRQTVLVAIGGGTIQDLTCFAASVYMRGVPWIDVPTTVLGMVDSCVGGKSSINAGPYKNLIGTFHPPQGVLIDPAIALTLNFEQQASGLIEAAKICFCRGADCFRGYLACRPVPGMEVSMLGALIGHSLRAKKWFIEIDEFDRKERLLLNFGHTFGHAIEGASGYGIPHGIAVGLGMLCALTFGREENGLDPYAGSPEVGALEMHVGSLLRAMPDLPRELAALSVDAVMERFESDKKHSQSSYVLILVDASGGVVVRSVERSEAVRRLIRRAVECVVESCSRTDDFARSTS